MNPPDPLFPSLCHLVRHARTYAGIGARITPPDTLALMRRIGFFLASRGLRLRSGAARGADSAFESGCDDAGGAKEIFLPWRGFNLHPSPHHAPPPRAEAIAALCHPNWRACQPDARRFHARNVQQVLGGDIGDPVDFVLFWARETDGKVQGGTATAVTLARMMEIPAYNLCDPAIAEAFDILVG